MDGYTQYIQKGKIKILGHDYTILEKPFLARDSKAAGTSCGNSQGIEIDNSLPLANKQSTLIHEILEQLDYLMELGLEHNKLQSIEAGLFAVIKDNPRIFDFECGNSAVQSPFSHLPTSQGGTNENIKSGT